MIDLTKFEEQIELDEAKKELCLISDRPKDFKKVEATILNKEFFAHKNKYTGWTITDKASGLALKSNFNTLADARDYLKTLTPEELEKLNEVKSTEKYKEQCAKLAAANIDDYELYEDYCYSVFKALEEDDQNTLVENNIIVEDIAFNDIIKAKNNNKNILEIEGIQDIGYKICDIFKVPHSKWPYQLQLMCNAYITELGVLNLLNYNNEFKAVINNCLKLLNTNKQLSNNYRFNGEQAHLILGAAQNLDDSNSKADLYSPDATENEIKYIEVKATKYDVKNAQNFHNADLSLIYLIDTQDIYLKLKYKKPMWIYKYAFPCICIIPNNVTVVDWTKELDKPNS